MDTFSMMQRRYREHDIPWDHTLPPPEVIELTARLQPGRALDLGCGPGRTCLYLAQHGWTCDGVDFVSEAVAMAQERAQTAGVADHVHFSVASVTQLDGFEPPYDLAIDIGCMHNLRGEDLHAYAAEVERLLRPDGMYLLFAHLADAADEGAGHGLALTVIDDLFASGFVIERRELGQTTVGETVRPSAWFWMRRTRQATRQPSDTLAP